MDRSRQIIGFLVLLCGTCIGALGDIKLSNDGNKVIWQNNSQTFSISASGSMSESVDYAWPTADGAAGQALLTGGNAVLYFGVPTTSAEHNLLSGTHTDTTAATPPSDGSLIVGNTNKWTETAMSGDASIAADGTVTVANDSHTHDDRYFTETEIGSNGATPGTSLVGVPILAGATYSTAQDFLNTRSAGLISGGGLTAGTAVVDVAAGTGMIKVTDSSVGEIHFFDWDAANDVALTDNALNYVYVNYNTGTEVVTVAATATLEDINLHTQIPIGLAWRSGDHVEVLNDGVSIADHEGDYWHRLAHRDTERMSGAEVAESGTRYLTVSAGSYYKITAHINTDAVDTTGAGRFQPVYRDGGGDWTFGAEAQQFSNILHDDGDGTPGNVGVAKYATYYVYQCLEGDIYIQYGQGGSNTLIVAQNEAIPTPPNYLLKWASLRAKIIILNGATNAISISNYTATGLTSFFAGVHNELSGLQGGTSSEYYHLTSTTHGYIDQDVTSGSSPTLDGTNLTGIPDGALDESYVNHTLADAENDFLVASGADVFVKKTLAETGAILEGDINHDNLVDFEVNEHFTEASIDHTNITAGDGSDHSDVVANTSASHTQGTDTTLGTQAEDLDMGFFDIVNPDNMDGSVDPTVITDIGSLDAYWRGEGNLTLDGESASGAALTVADGTIAYCDRGTSKGFDFDGSTGLTAAYTAVTGGAVRTCMAWVLNSTTGSNMHILDWGTGQSWQMALSADNPPKLSLFTGAGNRQTDTNAKLSDGTWHHVTVILRNASDDMADIEMYIDGVLDSSGGGTATAVNTGSANVTVGDNGAASGFFTGCIDEVAIFTSALSSSEVTAIYNAQKERKIEGTTIPDARNMAESINTLGDVNAAGDLDVLGAADIDGNTDIGGSLSITDHLVIGSALDHNGNTVGFYSETPVVQASAMTAPDASAPDTGDAGTNALIINMRARINELEAMLDSTTGVGIVE